MPWKRPITRKRNAISTAYSREAFRLCAQSLPRALTAGNDLEARGGMLAGAAGAGLAIEKQDVLAPVHAAANPLTACYGIVHGRAVGLMLPAVVRYNAEDSARLARFTKNWPAVWKTFSIACTTSTSPTCRPTSPPAVDVAALSSLASEAAKQ